MSKTIQLAENGQQDDVIDIGRLIGILLDNKWIIIASTSVFTVLGIVYALLATPIYRADALLQIEKAPSLNPLAEVGAMLGKEPPSQSEIEVLRSRMVLGQTVDILDLDLIVEPNRLPLVGDFLVRRGVERPSFAEGWAAVWFGESIQVESMQVAERYVGEVFALRVDSPRQFTLFYDDELLGTGEVGKTLEFLDGGLSLTISSINAAAGAEFNLRRLARLKAIAALKENLSISEQGKETGILNIGFKDPSLRQAQDVLRTVSDIYVAQNVQRQSEEARKSLEFLSQQLPSVQAELTGAEDKLNSYRTGKNSVDLSLETRSVLERLVNIEAQLNELEFSESEISRRFTPSHPTYSALLEKKSQLQTERANIEKQIDSLPETQQEILRLQRDVAVTQEIYVQLRNKVQEMQIAEASTVGNVRVLDEAVVFPEPVEPNKMLIVVLAALLGGMASIGFVLVRGMVRRGVESAEQIEALGLPVYATIPRSTQQERLSVKSRRKGERGMRVPVEPLAAVNPADMSIEALRSLRTALHFGMVESGKNTVMITGPSPGIGKSFISANLAVICAQLGQKVLLIDGDLRRGHMHSMFNVRSTDGHGLSDYLVGKSSVAEVIRSSDKVNQLDFIWRGSFPPNPSELLSTERFQNLLDNVGARYDLVIIDTPPVLAVTDAAVVGRKVGTNLLVARFQLNPPKEIEIAVNRLEKAGVKVNGAVLNALERTAAGAYTYGYDNYSYKGGSEAETGA